MRLQHSTSTAHASWFQFECFLVKTSRARRNWMYWYLMLLADRVEDQHMHHRIGYSTGILCMYHSLVLFTLSATTSNFRLVCTFYVPSRDTRILLGCSMVKSRRIQAWFQVRCPEHAQLRLAQLDYRRRT